MPATGNDHASASWTIRVNGTALGDDAARDLVRLRVEEDLDAVAMLEIELRNWDAATLRHTWSDSPRLAVGARVEAVFDEARPGAAPMFVGEITGIEPVWSRDRAPRLTVRAYDLLHRLSRSTVTRAFVEATDSEIAAKVAREFGLKARVARTEARHKHVLQSNQTGLDFLRSRARRNGFELFARAEELHFRAPAVRVPAAHTLRVGQEIEELAVRLSAAGQAGATSVRAWSQPDKREIVAAGAAAVVPTMGGRTVGPRRADQAFGKSTVTTATVPVRTAVEARALAVGRLTSSALAYVEADGEGPGLPTLRTGTTLAIEGAGDAFSGTYYVVQVTHTLTEDNQFRTAYRLGRTAT